MSQSRGDPDSGSPRILCLLRFGSPGARGSRQAPERRVEVVEDLAEHLARALRRADRLAIGHEAWKGGPRRALRRLANAKTSCSSSKRKKAKKKQKKDVAEFGS
ncbi:MAG: hypothetical protein WBC01_04815 [Solirubrobacterales bacterium]